MKKQMCNYCAGRGIRDKLYPMSLGNGITGLVEVGELCPACKGSGYIELQKTEGEELNE